MAATSNPNPERHVNGFHGNLEDEDPNPNSVDATVVDAREVDEEESCNLKTYSGMKKHVLGKKQPLRLMLGGGLLADIVLWKNTMASMAVLLWVTFIWILVKWGGFKMLPLICQSLNYISIMLNFRSEIKFLVNKLYSYIKQGHDVSRTESQPSAPSEVKPSNDLIMHIKGMLAYGFQEASKAFQSTAVENHLKHFITMNVIFWVVSVIGNWFDFVTLLYIVFLVAYTSLAFYGRYEDDIDSAIVKTLLKIHRHYLVLNANFLRPIRRFHFMKVKLH